MTSDIEKIKKIPNGYTIGKLYVSDGEKDKTQYEYSTEENAIFDENTYNFHLYPKDIEIMKSVVNDVGNKRKEVLQCLESFDDVIIKKTRMLFDEEKSKRDDKIYVCSFLGGRGFVSQLNGTKYDDAKVNCLYKYINACKNGQLYCMNFMRFYAVKKDENENNDGIKEINCILRCMQFERINGKYINSGKEGCDISYPDSEENKAFGRNSAGSFSYNPSVDFNDNSEEIARAFIEFINGKNK